MTRLLLTSIVLFVLSVSFINAQTIHPAIDTTDVEIKKKIDFIQRYFQADSNYKEYWHPKYREIRNFNNSTLTDGISRNFSPKSILETFDIEITEIQPLNDSLSYFKIMLSSSEYRHIAGYKYYLVEEEGKYYIDNCKDYEKHRFKHVSTQTISFYISPWIEFDHEELIMASEKLDSMAALLRPNSKISPIESYLCSSIEEMNVLTNMFHYYGYVEGFAHMEQSFIVSHNAPPSFLHEFVHIILGPSAGKNFFLGEGIASYLGGLTRDFSYQDGLRYLKNCFEEGRCTFELLLERKIYNPRDNHPTYAFAAAICDFIVSSYGYDYFLSLYDNPEVNDQNLIERICSDKSISREFVVESVLKIINGGDSK